MWWCDKSRGKLNLMTSYILRYKTGLFLELIIIISTKKQHLFFWVTFLGHPALLFEDHNLCRQPNEAGILCVESRIPHWRLAMVDTQLEMIQCTTSRLSLKFLQQQHTRDPRRNTIIFWWFGNCEVGPNNYSLRPNKSDPSEGSTVLVVFFSLMTSRLAALIYG